MFARATNHDVRRGHPWLFLSRSADIQITG
jgi:hypothetical protein